MVINRLGNRYLMQPMRSVREGLAFFVASEGGKGGVGWIFCFLYIPNKGPYGVTKSTSVFIPSLVSKVQPSYIQLVEGRGTYESMLLCLGVPHVRKILAMANQTSPSEEKKTNCAPLTNL
jgi:hypothetical protein